MVDYVEKSRFNKLCLKHRGNHRHNRLVGENESAFGHCLDIPCKAELFKFCEEILTEYTQ